MLDTDATAIGAENPEYIREEGTIRQYDKCALGKCVALAVYPFFQPRGI